MTATTISTNELDQIIPDFSHLPLDIHTLILDMLSPSDIIRLRKTCKLMLDTTSQRIVWLQALERMFNDNTVYPHSFPKDDMTLLELEYAAMAPQNWEFLALGHLSSQEEEIPSFATHTLQPKYNLIHKRYDQSARLTIIPGGRFLLLFQRGFLSLWDLGYISAIGSLRQPKMEPIAQIRSTCTSYAVHPSPDRSALRVISFTRKSWDEERDIYLYEVMEIFPSESSPKFTTIATLSVISLHNLDFTSICGDRLTLVYGPVLKIWDFKTDEWATWNMSESQRQIIMTNENIALIGKDNISVWDFPKLSPDAQRQATKPEPTTPTAPQRVLVYEENVIPDEDFSCSGLCDWYTDSPQPLWFDLVSAAVSVIVGDEEEEEAYFLTLSRFMADISDSPSSNIPLKSVTSFDLPASEERSAYLEGYRVSGRNIVIPWSDSLGIYCHLGASSPSPPADARGHSVTLRLTKDVMPLQVSFCPVSCRLAYISPTSRDIEIVDFLPPLDASHDNNSFYNVSGGKKSRSIVVADVCQKGQE